MSDIMHEIAASWRPEPVTATETIQARPAAALAALLDEPSPVHAVGDPLPPMWHGLYLLDWPAQSALGEDGHPRDTGFLPPLPERRRMFGGGRLTVTAPIRCGETITRESRVSRAEVKEGRSGAMLLVTVQHRFTAGGEPRCVEEQDLVYRQGTGIRPAAPSATDGAAPAGDWRYELATDPVLLFRFSALTGNAHRIHYDLPFAREVEGYPGLLVHGPLTALLLLELPRRAGLAVREYSYRARRPLYCGDRLTVTGSRDGDRVALAAHGKATADAMTGEALLSSP